MPPAPALLLANAPLTLVASGCLAAAVAVAGLLLLWMATAPRPDHLLPGELERDRRRLLRKRSAAYRWFEPVVDALGEFFRAAFPGSVAALEKDLLLVEPPAPRDPIERWHPEEYLAVRQVEGLGAGLAILFVIGGILDPVIGLVLALPIALVVPWVSASGVRSRANRYRILVRARLAMVIDLMALMLEADATIYQCVTTVAVENKGQPIGELFSVLADSIRRSVPQDEALRRMAEMIDDPDMNELVFTLTATGQSSGLRDILKAMTGPIRTKRIQHLERASEQAKVNITFPAMIIMCACLLIVGAVFALPAMTGSP